MSCSTFSAPGRSSEKVMTALASRTIRLIAWGASQLSLAPTLFEEKFQSLGVFAEAATEAADKFRSERLEDEAVFLFDEGHLGPFFDGILAAKLCGDDQLPFGRNGGDFSLHAGSIGGGFEESIPAIKSKSNEMMS